MYLLCRWYRADTFSKTRSRVSLSSRMRPPKIRRWSAIVSLVSSRVTIISLTSKIVHCRLRSRVNLCGVWVGELMTTDSGESMVEDV